jgi:hypothetical protein
MPADLPLIETIWSALQSFVREETCATCEGLRGALLELGLSLEELPAGPEQERLLAANGDAALAGVSRACLGCQPCNPGDNLANFCRDQQVREIAPQPDCCGGRGVR